jgi:hypothetical protein
MMSSHQGIEPVAGFRNLETLHCVTGSMRHVYETHGHSVSEDLLLGLGAGVGFVYWHQKGAPPFYGGRANAGGPKDEGLEVTAGRRTGVAAEYRVTSSAHKAEQTMVALLEAGEPVLVYVDMGFLPYFVDLPEDYHFGGHVVVVAGYDPASRRVLIADREPTLYPVSMEDLERARGSTFKPFPPHHRWCEFDFAAARAPTAAETRTAIAEAATGMLEPPISNFGVAGIRTAAKRTLAWPKALDAEALAFACLNLWIFIDATGGTGGGIFRYMYGRFLHEAAEITGEPELAVLGEEFAAIGDDWQAVAGRFKAASTAADPAAALPEVVAPLPAIADREEEAWTRLLQVIASD